MRQKQSDDYESIGILLVLLLVGLYFGFRFFWGHHGQIVAGVYLEWKMALLSVVKVFTDSKIIDVLTAFPDTVAKSDRTAAQVHQYSQWLGHYTRYIFAPILISIGSFFVYKGYLRRFGPKPPGQRTFTILELAQTQGLRFPSILPPIRPGDMPYDEDKKGITNGKWAKPLSPEALATSLMLVDADKNVDTEKLRQWLQKHLTRSTRLRLSLTIPQRILAAVFILRIRQDPEGKSIDIARSKRILDEANMLYYQFGSLKTGYNAPEGDALRREVKQVLSQYKNVLHDAAQKHGYVETLLISLLVSARKNGVLPTNEFLWLKPDERNLFYALNNAGRKAVHIEGAGAACHFNAEIVKGKPIYKPEVSKNIEGIINYLVDVKMARRPEETST